MPDDTEKTDDPATNKPGTSNPEPLGDAGKKALDEERRARRDAEKKLKDTETRLQQLEDRDKTDGEKLNDKVTAAEKRAADAESRALRLEVAATKGLNPAQAKRLVGSTIEELEADADEILEAFPSKPGATPPPSNKPKPDLSGGSDPTNDPDTRTIDDIVKAVRRF